MISWIIYVLVAFILFFVLFIAFQGINRGIKAKNLNNKSRDEPKSNNQNILSKISITNELTKLNKLHNDGVLNKKQFEAAKKKILG
tara:strand:+ start:582 stop:839 length:258 start_codon:yes stop_codon:yes gene_type:complete